MQDIVAFEGPNRFLSNFWPAPIVYGGIAFPTTEHAYQAAKSVSPDKARYIASLPTPGQAKRAGKTVVLRPDWEQSKDYVMLDLLRLTFALPVLRWKLLATEDA